MNVIIPSITTWATSSVEIYPCPPPPAGAVGEGGGVRWEPERIYRSLNRVFTSFLSINPKQNRLRTENKRIFKSRAPTIKNKQTPILIKSYRYGKGDGGIWWVFRTAGGGALSTLVTSRQRFGGNGCCHCYPLQAGESLCGSGARELFDSIHIVCKIMECWNWSPWYP